MRRLRDELAADEKPELQLHACMSSWNIETVRLINLCLLSRIISISAPLICGSAPTLSAASFRARGEARPVRKVSTLNLFHLFLAITVGNLNWFILLAFFSRWLTHIGFLWLGRAIGTGIKQFGQSIDHHKLAIIVKWYTIRYTVLGWENWAIAG
jgi:hypothetical protein